MSVVADFMLLDEISRYAVEYGADKDDEVFEHGDRQGWLTYTSDGQIVGMINFHLETGTMGAFHPYILRSHKDQYNGMVLEFFEWFCRVVPEQIVKLNVAIPTIFKGAVKAAIDVGMTFEGLDRQSYLSEFGPCDRIMLGITREEM